MSFTHAAANPGAVRFIGFADTGGMKFILDGGTVEILGGWQNGAAMISSAAVERYGDRLQFDRTDARLVRASAIGFNDATATFRGGRAFGGVFMPRETADAAPNVVEGAVANAYFVGYAQGIRVIEAEFDRREKERKAAKLVVDDSVAE